MSVSICLKLGTDEILMNCEKVISGKPGSNTLIPALGKDNKPKWADFRGVVDASQPPAGAIKIKLANINRFYWNDDANDTPGQVQLFDEGELVLGFCFNDGYYLGVDNASNSILHWKP